MSGYRGRLAPSPTGLLHLGHARTFWEAQSRARKAGGVLVLRIDDLDRARCRPAFEQAIREDLRWFGFDWEEGPDVGGSRGPYRQSERMDRYREALERLRHRRAVFPCRCSRRDIQASLGAPHAGEEEPVYPGTCREAVGNVGAWDGRTWRFRVPDGETVRFEDGRFGSQQWVAGRDFGDFVVWRADGMPSYQLACVVDDAAMAITEVVRGEDLLLSTARQMLLYRALGWAPPAFRHGELMRDESGARLAKRHAALSLGRLREIGARPEELRREWDGGG